MDNGKKSEPLEHRSALTAVRMNIRTLNTDYEKTEDDMKALQSTGQIIGEVLKQLDDERCGSSPEYSDPSHRQGVFWPALCRLVPSHTGRGQGGWWCESSDRS